MGVEYVRLKNSEKIYGNRNMLHMQLEFLNSIRSFNNYKNLREKEFLLKVSLKNRVAEAHALIAKLESFLPRSTFNISVDGEKKEEKASSTLMDEMEIIKGKLAR